MSLTYAEGEYPIAYDHSCDELLSYTTNVKPKKVVTETFGEFEIVPNFQAGYETVMIVGAMGSGKSFWCAQYMKAFRKLYKDRRIYVFSQKTQDPSLDKEKIKFTRVVIDDDFINDVFDLTQLPQYHNSLVLFDDFLSFPQKRYMEKMVSIVLQFITLARQYQCYTLITSHMFYGFNNRQLYASIQTEINKIVFFNGVNVYQLTYVMRNYFGHSNIFIRNLLKFDTNSRFTCVNKYPAYIVSRHKCAIIK